MREEELQSIEEKVMNDGANEDMVFRLIEEVRSLQELLIEASKPPIEW